MFEIVRLLVEQHDLAGAATAYVQWAAPQVAVAALILAGLGVGRLVRRGGAVR